MKIEDYYKHPMFADGAGMAIAQILTIIIGVITSVVLARNLALEDLGYYVLANSYLALGSFFTLPGMSVAMTKGMVKGYDNICKPAMLRSFLCALAGGVIMVLVGLVVARTEGNSQQGSMISWAAVMLPITVFNNYDVVLQAKRKFILSRSLAVVFAILGMLIIGLTAYLSKDLQTTLTAMLFTMLLKVIGGWWLTIALMSNSQKDTLVQQQLLSQGWEQSFIQFLNPIVGQLDRIMLGILNPNLVAIYHVGSIFPRQLKDNAKFLFSVPILHWSALDRESNVERVKKHGAMILKIGALLTLLICVTTPWLIPLFYGPMYAPAVLIAILLSLTIGFRLLGNMIWSIDLYQDNGRRYGKNVIITKLVYVLLIITLTPFINIYGVVVSLLIFDLLQFGMGVRYFRVHTKD
ncbi:MAG: hypothetical protein R3A13_04155 [Bdellovibrionota bacterium]